MRRGERGLTGAHDRMDQGLLRMFLPRPPLADVGLQLELQRIRHLETAGQVDQAQGNALIERAHDALDAALERLEQPGHLFWCPPCGAVGTSEFHNPTCPVRPR